jgi:hypothetical protein
VETIVMATAVAAWSAAPRAAGHLGRISGAIRSASLIVAAGRTSTPTADAVRVTPTRGSTLVAPVTESKPAATITTVAAMAIAVLAVVVRCRLRPPVFPVVLLLDLRPPGVIGGDRGAASAPQAIGVVGIERMIAATEFATTSAARWVRRRSVVDQEALDRHAASVRLPLSAMATATKIGGKVLAAMTKRAVTKLAIAMPAGRWIRRHSVAGFMVLVRRWMARPVQRMPLVAIVRWARQAVAPALDRRDRAVVHRRRPLAVPVATVTTMLRDALLTKARVIADHRW